jgi:hypothetical protein
MQRSRRILLQFTGFVYVMLAMYLSLPFLLPFLPKGLDLSDYGFAPNNITQSIVNPLRNRTLYVPIWTARDVENMHTVEYHVLVIWQVKYNKNAKLYYFCYQILILIANAYLNHFHFMYVIVII